MYNMNALSPLDISTDENLQAEKKKFREGIDQLQIDEVVLQQHLSKYRQISQVNACFLALFGIAAFLYPLMYKDMLFSVYLLLWFVAISVFVLRIRLYSKILQKEMEYVGLINLRAFFVGELEKLQKIEYDRLAGKVSPQNFSPEIPKSGKPADRGGENSRSAEE